MGEKKEKKKDKEKEKKDKEKKKEKATVRSAPDGSDKNVFAVKTCGLPRITSVMRNLTLDPGDTARLKLCFCNFSFYLFFPSFDCEVDMKCMVSVRPYCSNIYNYITDFNFKF